MSEALERAVDVFENAKTRPATHTIYTPVWNPDCDGGEFRKWLPIGEVWRDDRNGIIGEFHSKPINPEETATDYFHCVPVGEPPPEPLTMTREEFLEQQFNPCHDE